MKTRVTRDLFIDELSKYYSNSCFSNYGKHLLFKYFEDLDKQLNGELEIYFVDICCNWSENKLSETLEAYNLNSVSELEENTEVIKTYYLDENEYVLYKQF